MDTASVLQDVPEEQTTNKKHQLPTLTQQLPMLTNIVLVPQVVSEALALPINHLNKAEATTADADAYSFSSTSSTSSFGTPHQSPQKAKATIAALFNSESIPQSLSTESSKSLSL